MLEAKEGLCANTQRNPKGKNDSVWTNGNEQEWGEGRRKKRMRRRRRKEEEGGRGGGKASERPVRTLLPMLGSLTRSPKQTEKVWVSFCLYISTVRFQ